MMMLSSRRIFSVVVPFSLALAACSAEESEPNPVTSEASEEAELDEPESEEFLSAQPGDVIEVEDGIAVRVPQPGNLVGVEVMYDDGNTAVATLVNDAERGVFLLRPDEHLLGLPDGTAAACAGKCNENAYSYFFADQGVRAKWKSRLNWSYRHTNSPIGKNNAIEAFRHAAIAVPRQRNSCSMGDQSNAKQGYLGETTRKPNISKSGSVITCEDPDGHNVVGWGAIAGGTLAVNCNYATDDGSSTYRIVESDQRYDNSNRGWYAGNEVPSSCTNRFSLRGVATHEFGHAFGLGHTPAACNQTMSPSVAPCTSRNRRLGRGDVRGVRDLY